MVLAESTKLAAGIAGEDESVLLFDHAGMAKESYEDAYNSLLAAGINNERINELFSMPRILPQQQFYSSVEDALIVGVPDERWGQSVAGVVHLARGASLQEEGLRTHVKAHLAAYKAPKTILESGVALRAANGKADYKGATEFAISTLASS